MKKLVLSFLISFTAAATMAQNNIGIGTTTPAASAVLDITSTNKGLLIPRMTSVQRTAIVSPATGLLVYDTDAKSLYQYNGTIWVAIGGSSGGSLSLPYVASDAGAVSFQVTNTFTGGKAIVGKANTNSTSSVAISGEASAGVAVKGYSNDAGSIAVFGSSLQGTAVSAYSFAGTALDVNGKVKISGGNTNPSSGAVLTSDASGNAVWKPKKVAFDVSSSPTSVPDGATVNIAFTTQNYDAGGNYNLANAASNPNSFVAPVSGYYHFDLSFVMNLQSLTTNIGTAIATLSRNGTDFYIMQGFGHSSTIDSKAPFSESTGIHLNAGDVIRATAYQSNATSLTATIQTASFSGHLVFAD